MVIIDVWGILTAYVYVTYLLLTLGTQVSKVVSVSTVPFQLRNRDGCPDRSRFPASGIRHPGVQEYYDITEHTWPTYLSSTGPASLKKPFPEFTRTTRTNKKEKRINSLHSSFIEQSWLRDNRNVTKKKVALFSPLLKLRTIHPASWLPLSIVLSEVDSVVF